MKTIVAIALLTAGISPAAPLPKELRNRSDDELIVGNWQVERTSIDGNEMRGKKNRKLIIRFDTKGMRTVSDKEEVLNSGNYSLDQSLAPRRIKWRTWEGTELLCLYEMKDDKLKLVFVHGSAEIPKNLEPAKNLTIYTLSRIKD